MREFSIPRDYLKKCLFFTCLFGIIVIGSIGGCSNNDGGQDGSRAQTENDFADDPTLRDDPERGIVVDFLEAPGSEVPENDTGEVGVDEIPIKYRQTLEHTFCWEDDDEEAMHFMVLLDAEDNEILRVDVNGECVTEVIEAGDYIMTLHHDGRMETEFPIFIIPEIEDDNVSAGAKKDEVGMLAKAARVLSKIIERLDITQTTNAQTVQENISTLLSTRNCPGCDLRRADLSNANLFGADLSGAILGSAKIHHATVVSANFSGAVLPVADLSDSGFAGADFSGADLTGADLSRSDFLNADFTNADMVLVILDGARLIGADLTGADLRSGRWCDGSCFCKKPSIGTCNGCASVDICTFP